MHGLMEHIHYQKQVLDALQEEMRSLGERDGLNKTTKIIGIEINAHLHGAFPVIVIEICSYIIAQKLSQGMILELVGLKGLTVL